MGIKSYKPTSPARRFYTGYDFKELTPGVEVQASILESVMTGRVVRELPRTAALLLMALTAIASTWLMASWQPARSALVALGVDVAVAVLAMALFEWGNVWLPALALLVGVAVLYVAEGALAFLREDGSERSTLLFRHAHALYMTDDPRAIEALEGARGALLAAGDCAGAG